MNRDVRRLGVACLFALALLAGMFAGTYAVDAWQGRQTYQPADFVTVAASEGACTADYRQGAWHICDVTVPAPAEDTYSVTYRAGAWHVVYIGQ